ncbi:MAG: ISMsm3, transposase [Streptomyces oryziradicis]|nr:ISMsm3, transposase [Actinacidiphila oryziradicis]
MSSTDRPITNPGRSPRSWGYRGRRDLCELWGYLLETDRWQHRHRAAGRLNHPGAQLRFTGLDGMRLTCFATNTQGGQLPALELRHRRRARCEDRIRDARATGLRNLPLHDIAQNQIWVEIVSLALDLLAWMPMLALQGDTRRWEPKKLRVRLFSAAQLVTSGRRRILRLARHRPSPPGRRGGPVTGLGSGRAYGRPVRENGWTWHILADPDGNEFCVMAPPDA